MLLLLLLFEFNRSFVPYVFEYDMKELVKCSLINDGGVGYGSDDYYNGEKKLMKEIVKITGRTSKRKQNVRQSETPLLVF